METTKNANQLGFGTLAIHAGQPPEKLTGAVMTPIYQTSTYAQASPGKHTGYEYSRTDNPTRTAYQECLAALEGGKFALAFASGLATTDCILHTLKAGDHVVCCDDVYGGTFRLFERVYKQMGIDFTFVDLTDLKKTEAAFKPATKLLWLETPTNPTLKIVDIEALSALARKRGALTVVDNTFMSAYFQKPLALGADIVVHSVTKYMNGHSDVVGGALVTSNGALYEKLKFLQNAVGAVPGPQDCFLVMRGLKTLHIRMERHASNAQAIAEFLDRHPKVERVVYPGLKSHPQHDLARKQMSGFGGMITFFLKGGLPEARTFLEKVKLFTLAESLGGVESLIEHPAIMTHASVPAEMRAQLGIRDNLVRVSCGIEDLEDLKADLAKRWAEPEIEFAEAMTPKPRSLIRGLTLLAPLPAIGIGAFVTQQNELPIGAFVPNFLGVLLGIPLAIGLASRKPIRTTRAANGVLAVALCILASTLLFPDIEGVRRWLLFGPIRLNASQFLAPLLIWICSLMLDRRTIFPAISILLLHYFQPDAGQATALALSLCVLSFSISGVAFYWRALSALGALAVASFTWRQPDPLEAIPHVEGILHLATSEGPAMILMSVCAGLLLFLPPIQTFRAQTRVSLAMITYWATAFLVTELGNFPVPIFGAGAASVLGWYVMCGLLWSAPKLDSDPIRS